MTPRRKNDMLLKSAFEEAFPDLLRFYFKDADAIFDMEKDFEFLDKELGELFPELERQGGNRFVDMLVKTYLKNGGEEWILLHIEIEGGSSEDFAHRMLQYWYRIYDRYRVDISALAVFTGSRNQKRPDRFHKSFLGTEITYKYNVYHIFDHSELELLAMDNPFALIVLAAQKALLMGQIPEEELAEHRLTVAKALIASKRYDHERILRFLYFLKQFVYIESPKINRNFDQQINQLTQKEDAMGIIETIKKIEREEAFEKGIEKGMEKGIEKGIEKGMEKGMEKGIERGMEKGKKEEVRNLITKLGLSDGQAADVAGVTVAFVKKVRKEMK